MGLQATAAPALVIVLAIWGSSELAGVYGIGVAVMSQLSLCGLIVALDAFGPITDNAGGIAEMANMPEEVRAVTDPLDAVGNTTKAVTKGYAIGSAALAALVLFAAFKIELLAELQKDNPSAVVNFFLDDPKVLMGLLIGGMMVCLFAALSMEAVGRAGQAVVEEVRRQFREHPGIMDGTEQPEYGQCVDIVTKAAQREMIIPSLIPIVVTLIVGLLSDTMLGGPPCATSATPAFRLWRFVVAAADAGGHARRRSCRRASRRPRTRRASPPRRSCRRRSRGRRRRRTAPRRCRGS